MFQKIVERHELMIENNQDSISTSNSTRDSGICSSRESSSSSSVGGGGGTINNSNMMSQEEPDRIQIDFSAIEEEIDRDLQEEGMDEAIVMESSKTMKKQQQQQEQQAQSRPLQTIKKRKIETRI